jgi:hypothetical protein
VYGKGGKLYSKWYKSSLEAAAAYDLVKLAVQGAGAAVNLPQSVYAAEDVAAMAAFVQLKRRTHEAQQQQQQQHASEEATHDLQPTDMLPSQQQQQQAPHEQQQQLLLLRCLSVRAGRHLLRLRPETGLARLQALADLIGSSSSYLLSRDLKNGNYLAGVVGLTEDRMRDRGLALQQQLGLQQSDLQQLLRDLPSLLQLRSETLQQKMAALLPAFEQVWDAVQAAAAAADAHGNAALQDVGSRDAAQAHEQQQQQGRRRRRKGGQQLEQWLQQQPAQQQQQQQQQQESQHLQELHTSSAGTSVTALQRAVLGQPQVLLLSADKVVRRLQVLCQCCSSAELAGQVQKALQSGTIGRWLVAGGLVVILQQ